MQNSFPKIKLSVRVGALKHSSTDAILLPVFTDGSLPPVSKAVDKETKGWLTKQIERDRFGGENSKLLWVEAPDGWSARVLLTSIGMPKEFDRSSIRDAYGTASKELADRRMENVAIAALTGRGFEENIDAATEGFLLNLYRFQKYKTDPKDSQTLREVVVLVSDSKSARKIEEKIHDIHTIVQATFAVRDLINEPANVVNPTYFQKQAEWVAKDAKISIKVLDEKQLRALGMNLILAVGMGSVERPRLLHLEYKPKKKAKRTVGLVGKGVTFDSGGLSLKPQTGMYGMKCDMGGAASVLMAIWTAAKLELPVHVHAFAPLVENLPSGSSVKPGDVFVGLGGKSVEIENTDAEGRLILADALAYAQRFGLDEIVDVATLTGACVVALGEDVAAVLSDDGELSKRIVKAGEYVGEKFWRMPLERSYKRMLKSDVADMKNTGGRNGGTITAGLFLAEFVKTKSWAHLDIAGPAFIERDWPTGPKGATGFALRTFVQFLR